MASNVSFATNSYDAYESFADHMDSTRAAVVAFDACLHRSVFRVLSFESNRMETVSLATMMIWMRTMTMMVSIYCHDSNAKWAAHFSVALLVLMKYCALRSMN